MRNYQDLTPSDNVDKKGIYADALECALNNDNIKNIAITGGYGSGKSSVIKTFLKSHRNYKVLNISLASFEKSSEKKNNNLNRLLELSILQQMFYHVKPGMIPDSRFRRIQTLSRSKKWIYSLLFLVWIICLLNLTSSTLLPAKFHLDQILILKNEVGVSICTLFFLMGVFYLVNKLIEIFNNCKLKTLNIQGKQLGIEIDKDQDSSILNKHLDEILYFFEVVKFELVIIEDLDRFENAEIFTKLRELNLLINQSKQVNRRVVFLYALNDALFNDVGRIKFFDFVIPIIPVINASNSGDVFVKDLRKADICGIDSKIENFINDVSLYVDDMRLLKNIFNEFLIYKSILNDNLDATNLLAIIVYKNKYPSDFKDLHKNEGMVFKIFSSKSKMIEDLIQKKKTEIETLKDRIEQIKKLSLVDVHELRAIYVEKILEKSFRIQSFQTSGNNYPISTVTNDDKFPMLYSDSSVDFQINSYNSGYKFKNIEDEINKDVSYLEREKLINERNEFQQACFEGRIKEIEYQISDMKQWSLHKILNKLEVTSLFESITQEKLIIFLIRNGYIREDYYDYISYFYDGFLTFSDREFLLSIKNRKALDSKYPLDKISDVVKRIQIYEFDYEECLNYDLLRFLISYDIFYKKKYDKYIGQLANNSRTSLLFLEQAIKEKIDINTLIPAICNQNSMFWSNVSNQDISEEGKDQFLIALMESLEIEQLEEQNSNDIMSEYISHKKDFLLTVSSLDKRKVCDSLKALDVKFVHLNVPEEENIIFDCIYEFNLYEINIEMIRLILQKKGNLNDINSIEEANYTTIVDLRCDFLLDYVENNISTYIKDIFLRLPNNTKESSENISYLLNNYSISYNDRLEIIDKSDNKIESLRAIHDDNIVDYLIRNNSVDATWENVVYFFTRKENIISEELSAFLNKNDKELCKSIMNDKPGVIELFFIAIINNLSIDVSCLGNLLKSCSVKFELADLSELPYERVNLLIERGVVSLSAALFNNLKDSFNDSHIRLLGKFADEFIASLGDYKLDGDDLQSILLSSNFNDDQKRKVLLTIDFSLIDIHKKLAIAISDFYIRRCIKNIPIDLLIDILPKLDIVEDQVDLLNLTIWQVEFCDIDKLLFKMKGCYSELTSKSKNPIIENTKFNKLLVSILKERGYISSFKEKNDKIRIFTKRK